MNASFNKEGGAGWLKRKYCKINELVLVSFVCFYFREKHFLFAFFQVNGVVNFRGDINKPLTGQTGIHQSIVTGLTQTNEIDRAFVEMYVFVWRKIRTSLQSC